MTLTDALVQRFRSVNYTQPQQVWTWMQTESRTPTLTEIAQHFSWSVPHTLSVVSRLPIEPLR